MSTSTTLSRRTVLSAASWIAPIITASTALPAYAASTAGTLAFGQASYSITASQPSPELTLRATRDGTHPASTTSVTVTLPDGFRFTTGATARPYISDASGTVVIPAGAFTAPAVARDGTITAAAAGMAANATLVFVPVSAAFLYDHDTGTTTSYTSVPPTAMVVGGYSGFGGRSYGTFITPEGGLYYGNTPIASGVTSAVFGQDNADSNRDTLTYTKADGSNLVHVPATQATTAYPSVPAGSRAVGKHAFLSPDNTLTYKQTTVATGVTAVGFDIGTSSGVDFLTYVAGGTAYRFSSNGNTNIVEVGVPADAIVTGAADGVGGWAYRTFLTPSGDLYWSNAASGASLLASGVTSAAYSQRMQNSRETVTYISGGVGYVMEATGAITGSGPRTRIGAFPAGTKAIGWRCFIAPAGDLYFDTNVVATNVISAGYHQSTADRHDYLTYTQATCAV